MQPIEKELENDFQIVKQDELAAILNLIANKKWVFYQGHFPGMPVLPGYAITEISVFFAQKIFAPLSALLSIYTLRMRNPILPGCEIELAITKDKLKNRFQMSWKSAGQDGLALASIDFELSEEPSIKNTIHEEA